MAAAESARRKFKNSTTLAKSMLTEHFSTDVCTRTLLMMVSDLPTRGSPRIYGRYILSVAIALGFRARSTELKTLCQDFSQAAARKYWCVLWSPRPNKTVPKWTEDDRPFDFRSLDTLFTFQSRALKSSLGDADVSHMAYALYSTSKGACLSNSKEHDAAVAVQLVRACKRGLAEIATCIAPDVLEMPIVAEGLLMRRDAWKTDPTAHIGTLRYNIAFMKRMVKKRSMLLKHEVCGLKQDRDFVLSMIEDALPSVCSVVFCEADRSLREDGTFIYDAVCRRSLLYERCLTHHERTNPLYALAYLKAGVATLSTAYDILRSDALANSTVFAEMLLQNADSICCYGVYHIYSLFVERIRMDSNIALLAFKACNGLKRERKCLLLTVHLTLFGNADFIAKARLKSKAVDSLKEAVLERVRPDCERNTLASPMLNVRSTTAEPNNPYGMTEIEKAWLAQWHPELVPLCRRE